MKNFLFGDNDYGFIKASNMPNGNFKEQAIKDLDFNVNSTADFSKEAKNHCGATQAVNLYKLYANRMANFNPDASSVSSAHSSLSMTAGITAESKYDSSIALFRDIHKYVPDGPVLFLARKIKSYFSTLSINFSYRKIPYKKIQSSINNNKPVALLLVDGLFNWHWVLAVGYRIYENGEVYLRLINNHDRSSKSYYRKNKGSFLIHACEYSIEKPELD